MTPVEPLAQIAKLTAVNLRSLALSLLDLADDAEQASGIAPDFDFDPFDQLNREQQLAQSDKL